MSLNIVLSNFMKNMGVRYAICGGYAIDGFIGHKTRPHKDLDVAAFQEDRDQVVAYMLNLGWNLYEPCGCKYLHIINDVRNQKKLKTNIWCVNPMNKHYLFVERGKDMYEVSHDDFAQTELDFIEFLFNKEEDNSFIYARDNSIHRTMNKSILNINGIQYLAPEIVLLYKSNSLNNKDYQADFDNTFHLLSVESRMWLKNALECTYPNGHEWLLRL